MLDRLGDTVIRVEAMPRSWPCDQLPHRITIYRARLLAQQHAGEFRQTRGAAGGGPAARLRAAGRRAAAVACRSRRVRAERDRRRATRAGTASSRARFAGAAGRSLSPMSARAEEGTRTPEVRSSLMPGHGETPRPASSRPEASGREPLARDRHGGRAVGCLLTRNPRPQVDSAEQADRRLVVDDEPRLASGDLTRGPLGASRANSTTNVEPLPSSDSTQMRPPIAVTKPRTR